jgi:hypothetical protein
MQIHGRMAGGGIAPVKHVLCGMKQRQETRRSEMNNNKQMACPGQFTPN